MKENFIKIAERRKHRRAMAERDANYANRWAGIEIEKSEIELFGASCRMRIATLEDHRINF